MSQNREAVEAAHARWVASNRAAVLEARLQEENTARHQHDYRAEVQLRHNRAQLTVLVPVLENSDNDDRIDNHADMGETVQPCAIAGFRFVVMRLLLVQLCIQVLELDALLSGIFNGRQFGSLKTGKCFRGHSGRFVIGFFDTTISKQRFEVVAHLIIVGQIEF